MGVLFDVFLMRQGLFQTFAGVLIAAAASAQTGIPPRGAPADYAAQQTLQNATLAATLLPAEQVTRVFSQDVSRRYLVVEVAAIPEIGNSFDVLVLDFVLKAGEDTLNPVTAGEVAWHGRRPPNPSPSVASGHIVGEVGIGYGTRPNPVTGRPERGLDTWAGAGVDNRPSPNPPNSSADRIWQLEGKLQALELPEGPATRPVAGYLYFAMPSKKTKTASRVLEYSHGAQRARLTLTK